MLAYLRLGRLVYGILKRHMPQLAEVPVEDLLSVVEEILQTTATVEDARIQAEPIPAHLVGGRGHRPQYRLVLPQGPRS